MLGATGALAGIGQLLTLGGLQAATAISRLAVLFVAILVVLAFVVGPYMQAAQAMIYIDQIPVLVAYSRAFAEAYGRGRFGHWLLTLLISIVFDLAASLIEAALGSTGQVFGILLSPAVLWLMTALCFATYRTHETSAPPAEIIS